MSDDEIRVHHAAAVFPMLSDDELADLAADIKANGLLHPITLDRDGQIVDGRNRHAACLIADVDPDFEVLEHGVDPFAFILSQNIHRRHLSKGQQAMAIALMIETEEGKRDSAAQRLSLESKLSKGQISQAVTIRRYAGDLVPGVMAGTESFDKAYDVARTRKQQQDDERQANERQANADLIELERLRRVAPDLAALVPDTITVTEARAALAEREQRTREARESLARVADTACGFLDPGVRTTSDELAARIVETLDPAVLPHRPIFSAARFARCAETAAAIARLLALKEGLADGHVARR